MTLAEHLSRLEAAQLVRRLTLLESQTELSEADLAYIFKHALTQETAYTSLLRKSRGGIHRLVAQTYERIYSDRLDQYAALLARHYAEAGDDAKTLEYARRAGDAASRVYAHAEAITHYTQALEIARRSSAPQQETSALLEHLYLARGQALGYSGQYEAALAGYEEMSALGRERGDRVLELAGLIAMATLHSTPNPTHDPVKGQVFSEQALALARELGDRVVEAKILWSLQLLHTFDGEPRTAIGFGEEALAVARDLGLPEQTALVLNGLAMAYWPTGEMDKARAALEEAQGLWRKLGHLPMLVESLARLFLIHFMAGDYDRGLAFSAEGYQISRSIGDLRGQANSLAMVGHIYLERGEVSEAMRVMEQAIQAGEQSANPATQIATRADLGWVYGMLGAPERGIELARLAQGRAEILYPLFRPWATAVLARLYLLRGQISEAQAALQECYRDLKPEGSFHAPLWVALADGELAMAQGNYPHVISLMDDLLAYLRRLHSRPYRTDALYLKGRALTSLGRLDEAEQVLASARAEAEALGSRRGLWPILAALGTIAARQGDRVAESNLHTQAREIAEYIADRAPTSELGVSLRRMHGLA